MIVNILLIFFYDDVKILMALFCQDMVGISLTVFPPIQQSLREDIVLMPGTTDLLCPLLSLVYVIPLWPTGLGTISFI